MLILASEERDLRKKQKFLTLERARILFFLDVASATRIGKMGQELSDVEWRMEELGIDPQEMARGFQEELVAVEAQAQQEFNLIFKPILQEELADQREEEVSTALIHQLG